MSRATGRRSPYRRFWLMPLLLWIGLGAAQDHTPPTQGSYSGAKETVYPDWFKDSFLIFEEDLAEAAESGKRLALFFHQAGCPYCNALVERNLSQKDIAELMRKRFDVIALNLWGDRELVSVGGQAYTEKTFAQALRVQFTPTLLFFNEQGEIVLRLNGYRPPQQFRLALQYAVDPQGRSFRDYLAAHAPPAASGERGLNAQAFFTAPPYDLSSDERQRPLAVFFEQQDCPNCAILHDEVLNDAATRSVIEQFKAVQLDMWSDTPVITPDGERSDARRWAKRLDIDYAPTIVLFDRQGREIIRSAAYFKSFHTQSLFHYVLSGAFDEQPSFQRYLSARADELREQGIDVDIWR